MAVVIFLKIDYYNPLENLPLHTPCYSSMHTLFYSIRISRQRQDMHVYLLLSANCGECLHASVLVRKVINQVRNRRLQVEAQKIGWRNKILNRVA